MSDHTRPHAGDFDPEVMRLFDQYVHGAIDRRGVLAGAARFAAGAGGAAALLAALNPRFAEARQVEPDDARLATRSMDTRRIPPQPLETIPQHLQRLRPDRRRRAGCRAGPAAGPGSG